MTLRTTFATPAFGLLSVCLLSSSVAHAEDSTSRVALVAVPGDGQAAAARLDTEGTIHLLYNSPDGPQYTKSTDSGSSFTAPIPVVDRGSRKAGLEFEAWDMAVGKSGRVHVVMSTNAWKLKLPKEEWAMRYASLDPGAKAFTPVQNFNHQPSEGYSLAADDQGNVTACWLSDKLYASVSHDDGKTFAPAVEINPSFDPCNCCTTSSVYGADGKLAVLYREETNNERDMFLVLWDQAHNEVSRTRVSSTLWKIDACPMTYYTIARTPSGYAAVWPTDGQIYFARLDSQGALLPPTEIKTPGKTGMRTAILALTAPDASTLIAWKNNNQLSWQLYDHQGRPSGSPSSTKSPGKGLAGVLAPSGRFLLFR